MSKNLLRLNCWGSPSVFLNQRKSFFLLPKSMLCFTIFISMVQSIEKRLQESYGKNRNQTAKKNLRNTIYQANKLLGWEWIVAPNRTVLSLNPECAIESDVERFTGPSSGASVALSGDFCRASISRTARPLITGVQDATRYEQLYIQACYQQLEAEKDQLDLESAERNLRRLISIGV